MLLNPKVIEEASSYVPKLYFHGEAQCFGQLAHVIVMEQLFETIDSFFGRHVHLEFDVSLRRYLTKLLLAQLRLYVSLLGKGLFFGDAHAANVGVVEPVEKWKPDSTVQVKLIDLEMVRELCDVTETDIIEHGDQILHEWVLYLGNFTSRIELGLLREARGCCDGSK